MAGNRLGLHGLANLLAGRAAHCHTPAPSMHWVVASLVAAFFLGIYELCTKHAVNRNAVLPVLFFANVVSSGLWGSLLVVQRIHPHWIPAIFSVPPLTAFQHAQLALKSFIVACSWMATYFAVKHLPVSIASPIRAMAPVCTLVGALLVLGERPTWMQIAGILITLGSFVALSIAGRVEGIHFHRDKWVGWAVLGMMLGALSTLYDKYLLGTAGYGASTVQAWFSIYLALFFIVPVLGWKLRWWPRQEFHWRWSIVWLTLALLVSDFVYFSALRDPDALISVVASLRRGNTLVAFAGGLIWFGEVCNRRKAFAVGGVLLGIVITLLA
jgi:transporter family protein